MKLCARDHCPPFVFNWPARLVDLKRCLGVRQLATIGVALLVILANVTNSNTLFTRSL
jgi:hypothetical protein